MQRSAAGQYTTFPTQHSASVLQSNTCCCLSSLLSCCLLVPVIFCLLFYWVSLTLVFSQRHRLHHRGHLNVFSQRRRLHHRGHLKSLLYTSFLSTHLLSSRAASLPSISYQRLREFRKPPHPPRQCLSSESDALMQTYRKLAARVGRSSRDALWESDLGSCGVMIRMIWMISAGSATLGFTELHYFRDQFCIWRSLI